jgi:hypothetical protein
MQERLQEMFCQRVRKMYVSPSFAVSLFIEVITVMDWQHANT